MADLPEELARVCGPEGVRLGGAADAVSGVVPALVATPHSVDEVSAVLRAADGAGAAVCAVGAGTALGVGTPPRALDLVVSTAALDRVLDHSPGDLRVQVQAGVRLGALQRHLAGDRQRLAVDPADDGTLGGIVATNAAGALRHRYGSPRDLLLGVTLVLADGTVARAGGKVVKNVAGYDLCKLVTGSYGTLAVLVEATFRLHHVPSATRWLRHDVAGADQLRAIVAGYAAQRVEPSALELDVDLDSAGGAVYGLLEGSPSGVEARAARVLDALGGTDCDGPPNHATTAGTAGSAGQGTAGDGAAGAEGTARQGLVCTVAVRPAGVAGLVERWEDSSALRGLGATATGRAGVGVLGVNLPGATADDAGAALAQLRELAGLYDGTAVVQCAPAGSALDVWGPVRGLELMRRVKEQFDPRGTLAPGRYVGGI